MVYRLLWGKAIQTGEATKMSVTDASRKVYQGPPEVHRGVVGFAPIAIWVGNPGADGQLPTALSTPARSISMSILIENRDDSSDMYVAFPTAVDSFDALAELAAGRFKTIDPNGVLQIDCAIPYFIIFASGPVTYEIVIVHEETVNL